MQNSHRVYRKRLEDETKEKLKQNEKLEVAKRKREDVEFQRQELNKLEERKKEVFSASRSWSRTWMRGVCRGVRIRRSAKI